MEREFRPLPALHSFCYLCFATEHTKNELLVRPFDADSSEQEGWWG